MRHFFLTFSTNLANMNETKRDIRRLQLTYTELTINTLRINYTVLENHLKL